LRKLEDAFADTLVVIGVQSGKYHAERVTERIREASIRLGVEHAIVKRSPVSHLAKLCGVSMANTRRD
jgi:hypothetical protein